MPLLTRWLGAQAPSERELRALYAREGLQPYAWSNGPRDRYAEHEHPYHKVLYCVAGSIRFLVRGEPYDLAPGDRLDPPAGTPHAALVGPRGVTCLEGHRPG
jgi:mannose-6-phosphate isomerase-like protein (cupin superfamily)